MRTAEDNWREKHVQLKAYDDRKGKGHIHHHWCWSSQRCVHVVKTSDRVGSWTAFSGGLEKGPTSRHQSAREKTRENIKLLKIVMVDSQAYHQDRPQDLKKKKINIQEFRPGCSAMQWHCRLHLSLTKIFTVWCIRNCAWSVVLNPLF